MNLVEITVRTKDTATSELKATERNAKDSGARAGGGFRDAFSKAMGGSGGLFGNLFGGSSSGNSDAEKAGRSAGSSFLKGFKSVLAGSGKSGGGADLLNAGGVAGGALPGIMGISGKKATMLGLGGAALGALPALIASQAALGLAGAGGSVISAGAKQLIGTKNTAANPNAQGPLYDQAQQITKAFQSAMKNAATGMLAPLKQAFNQIPSMIKSIEPALKSVFAGAGSLIGPLLNGVGSLAKQVLPGLGAAFKAVGPLITPLVSGIGGLIKGILPGLVSMLKAAMPAVSALGSVLGMVGKGIGGMLSSFAPVLGASAVIFKALGGVIAAILPVVGKLAAAFASALGPVFVSFAGAIKALLPVLTVIGKVIAQFASAVVGDLAGVFGTIGTLVKDLAPSIGTLAKAFGQVFNVLENSGVFAILGDALENIAPLLAKLINTLVSNLAPVFPVLIQAVSQLGTILITLLSAGLTTLLQVLIPIVGFVAKVVASFIMWLEKTHLLLPVLAAVAIALNPVGAAVVGVIAVVGLLSTHWRQIWGDIKQWTGDAIKFIENLFSGLPKPLQEALKVYADIWKVSFDIVVGVVRVASSIIVGVLKAAWDLISASAKAGWAAIAGVLKAIWAVIVGIWKVTIDLLTGNWQGALNAMKATGVQVWNAIKGALQGIWNALKGGAQAVWNAMKGAASGAWNAMKSSAVQVWNSIKSALGSVWNGMKSAAASVWSAIKSDASGLWSALKSGFNTVVGAIGTAWGKLQNVFKGPVNFLINTVYMGGIRRLWDDVMGAIGLSSLDLPAVKGLAAGGKLPGYGGGDQHLRLLESGEAVVDKDRTRKYAPLLAAMGVPGMKTGGLVGDAINVGKMVLAAGTGNQVAFVNAFKDFLPHGGGAGGDLATMIATAPVAMIKHIVSGLWGKITGAAAASSGGGGGDTGTGGSVGSAGGGVTRWSSQILKALSMLGQSSSNLGPVEHRMNQESGGNPYAVNKSDSNWVAGHPSVGLMQVIRGTYAANSYPAWRNLGPSQYGVSENPTANIYAGLHHAIHDYRGRSLASVMLQSGGYANGGATSAGWAMVGERGRELIKVPGGATVYPAGASAQMTAGGPASPVLVQLEITGGQSATEQFLLKIIREQVRIKGGGNVQAAFGRN